MAEQEFELNRRSFLGLVALGIFDFSLKDTIFGPDSIKVASDEAEDRGDYDEDEFDFFFAEDTGAVYRPDETEGGWEVITTTGENPIFESVVVDNIRTKKIGVSAAVGTDQAVSSGEETKLNLDKTDEPYFDDFDELDENQNKVVLAHGSHHEVIAHAFMSAASATGDVDLRIYVNGTQRAQGNDSVKNGEEAALETSIYLKLDEGDEVEVKVEHDTGGEETFPADKNYASVVRQ